MAFIGRHYFYLIMDMDNIDEIIKGLAALYSIAGRGIYLTDYDVLKTGVLSFLKECGVPQINQSKIWGIVSDIYNRERNYSLKDDEIIITLEQELYEYFKIM